MSLLAANSPNFLTMPRASNSGVPGPASACTGPVMPAQSLLVSLPVSYFCFMRPSVGKRSLIVKLNDGNSPSGFADFVPPRP